MSRKNSEAYQRAVEKRDEAKMVIGNVELATYVRVDPAALLVTGEGSDADVGAAYARRLRTALRGSFGEPVKAVVVPWMGARTGGPTPPQAELVYILGLAGDIVGRVVDLATMYILIEGGLRKIEEATRNKVTISDGVAVLAAADAVFEDTGERDLTLAFASHLMAYTVGLDEMDAGGDGFLVGFRSEFDLILVRVDSFGRAQVLPERTRLPEREVGVTLP